MKQNFVLAMCRSLLRSLPLFFAAAALLAAGEMRSAHAQSARLVPGTGSRIPNVGDDFEDETWAFDFQAPKSSEDIDKQRREPGGESSNGRWYEGIKRGYPDIVKRVPTPPGGIEGSKGSMLLQSRDTGVPGRPGYKMQQDDFICDVHERLGGAIPVSQQPSAVAHVYLPPLEKWERRTGPTFGFRVAVDTMTSRPSKESGYPKGGWHRETYWPGFFIEFRPKFEGGPDHDTAYLVIRSDESGSDYEGPAITQLGWWTLGISCTADGAIHYYAHSGVEPLTEKDHVASNFSYSFKAQRFKTFFFNVTSPDNGRTWSTPWIVDDCYAYFVPRQPNVATRPGGAR